MSADRPQFEQTLHSGIDALGLCVPSGVVPRLSHHYALLVRWAKRINLTTVTDPQEAAIRHALDCLLFAESVAIDAEADLVDVGSGGGFPGIVVAVARPHLRVTLLEPIRKRTSFLRVAVAELGLDNVRVVDGKLLPDRPDASNAAAAGPALWPAQIIVSRATIPPLALIPQLAPVLRPGGLAVISGGQGLPPVSEIIACATDAGLRHRARQAYVLPGGAPRWLDEIVRPGDADPQYG